jgi:C-terminal processing protease CtpA/Prc
LQAIFINNMFSTHTRLMRYILVFMLGCSFVATDAQNNILYYANAPEGFAAAKIPKQMLEKDMQYWQTVMEESHVNPYHAISREALLQLQKDILAKLPDSVTHFQASFAISELIGALNEGHLGFASNRVADSLYAYDCIRFPYLIYDIDNGSLIVQRDLSGNNKLSPFSRIVSVNGISVQQLYERYARFYGGLDTWKKLMIKNNIRRLLYMDGIESPFTIKAVVNNDTLQFVTDGYTKEQTDSITKVLSAEAPPFQSFSFRFLENNIALIEFNTMDGILRDSFSLFLNGAFAGIKKRQAAGVIVDIRKNGGGDSGLGDTLISYISDKPYRNAGGMKMRISKHSKAYARMMNYKDPFSKWEDGKLYDYKATGLMKPADKKLRYQGKVCVLIGNGTFSSANMLTNAIKDFQLATLIGESTAEPANDFGEIFYFMLPNTHIVAPGAVKMFTRANGDEKDFNGIRPDIEIKNSMKDIQQKKDKVIEKAVEWILQK